MQRARPEEATHEPWRYGVAAAKKGAHPARGTHELARPPRPHDDFTGASHG